MHVKHKDIIYKVINCIKRNSSRKLTLEATAQAVMKGKGLDVIDLGVDVDAETFVQTAIDNDCQIIACSALLTTTMSVMEDVVSKAKEAGIREKVKIMVGGAPINDAFCKTIGADAYTSDAASAAEKAIELLA